MKYIYRDERGTPHQFRCELDDTILVQNNKDYLRIGKVIAMDNDGWLTMETPTGEVRAHNDWIICVANDYPNYEKIFGRVWLKEVSFVPNTNWMNDEHYNNDGHDDWLVGEFFEGQLWMNNNQGYVVLVQRNGVCLFDYI